MPATQRFAVTRPRPGVPTAPSDAFALCPLCPSVRASASSSLLHCLLLLIPAVMPIPRFFLWPIPITALALVGHFSGLLPSTPQWKKNQLAHAEHEVRTQRLMHTTTTARVALPLRCAHWLRADRGRLHTCSDAMWRIRGTSGSFDRASSHVGFDPLVAFRPVCSPLRTCCPLVRCVCSMAIRRRMLAFGNWQDCRPSASEAVTKPTGAAPLSPRAPLLAAALASLCGRTLCLQYVQRQQK